MTDYWMIHQSCINHLLTVYLYLVTIDWHSVNHLWRIGKVSGSVGELKANIVYILKNILGNYWLCQLTVNQYIGWEYSKRDLGWLYRSCFFFTWRVDHVWALYNEVLTAPATCHMPTTNKFTFPENTISLFCAFDFNFCYTTNIHIMIHVFSKILWSWRPVRKSEGIIKYCFLCACTWDALLHIS